MKKIIIATITSLLFVGLLSDTVVKADTTTVVPNNCATDDLSQYKGQDVLIDCSNFDWSSYDSEASEAVRLEWINTHYAEYSALVEAVRKHDFCLYAPLNFIFPNGMQEFNEYCGFGA